ncbi:hypothetical protein L6R52_13540 [Myxococcota bacterium]|nr:hypothetical protein [Myxococcota bacterium]
MLAAEHDNLLRFDGQRRGFYEVYFIEVQDAAHETGLWIRYTLRSPRKHVLEPVAEVWAMYFDRLDPSKNLALKHTVPFSVARAERDRLHLSIAGCELSHSGCRGAIERDGRRIEWDLTWDDGVRLVHFPFESMYSGALPKTKVVSPHFHMHASGRYAAHGVERRIEGEPGQQSHLWGTQHAHRWIWAHSNTFAEDPTAAFEGLSAEIKLGPVPMPPLTMFALRWRGKDYVFNKPRQLLQQNESRTDAEASPRSYHPVAKWIVGGGDDSLRFRGELWSDLSHYVGVRYTDPDGSGLVCNHSKVANARFEILVPDGNSWRVAERLTSTGATAIEFVGHGADPRVPILV